MNISAPDALSVQSKWTSKVPKLLSNLPGFGKLFDNDDEDSLADEIADSINYISLVTRMTDMMIQHNTVMMTQYIQPDILAEMPMNQFPTFAFDRTEEIIELGRQLMRKALDNYEAKNSSKT